MNQVLIALGSNLGDKKLNIESAVEYISKSIGIILTKATNHATDPVGDAADQKFLNSALICKTELTPDSVLKELLSIENELGRVRKEHWGNRLIDLDILLYIDSNTQHVNISTETLTIPHLFMHERSFVLDPACEIAADWIHPILGQTLKALKENLK